jgi:flagellin
MVAAINGDENLKTMFKASYDDSTDKITLTALNDKDGVTITGLTSDDTKVTGGITGETAYGAGQTVDFDLTKLKSGDTISVNGQSYQFLKSADVSKADPSATVVLIDENSTAATAEENTVKNFQAALKNNGLDTKVKGTGAAAQLLIESDAKVQAKGGLTLQIGDTAESFNQLNVSVGDMHTKALKIDDIDIGSQPGADAAMAKIKAAINSVSSTRGDLGALQNRLDHTINNLSVMHENIQDAEATIRDTDVAEEMMAYTKNNILVQSAQAMLAQANQLPQGVLQLLG